MSMPHVRDLEREIRGTELRLEVLRNGLAMPWDGDAIEHEQRLLDHLLTLQMGDTMGRMKDLMGDKPVYPDAPGFKERGGTSEAAAKATEPRVGSLRAQALAEITRLPGTPDEIAARLNKSVLAIRPRITELIDMGLVRKSGKTRPNDSGHEAAVIERIP